LAFHEPVICGGSEKRTFTAQPVIAAISSFFTVTSIWYPSLHTEDLEMLQETEYSGRVEVVVSGLVVVVVGGKVVVVVVVVGSRVVVVVGGLVVVVVVVLVGAFRSTTSQVGISTMFTTFINSPTESV